ncbi:MAG TPA: helix-turn-helix transcriptional regulator [Acetobacteraceae bacterium]|nr:helix-turn-helix transcriptional regulator [Acetobacteraceae bacterium]
MSDDPAGLSPLLGAIYDAPLEPAQWEETIAQLRTALGGAAAAFFHFDSAVPGRTNATILDGYASSSAAEYTQHFGGRDIRMPHVLRLESAGVYADDRQMPFADVARSEIFQDFYRPLGLGHGIATKLFGDQTRISVLSVHRPRRGSGFDPKAVALLETVAPHLVRALQLQRQVERARSLAHGLAAGLDHFHMPVFLVDRGARVLELNSAATDLLRRADSPLRCVQGQLATIAPRLTARLHESVRSASGVLAGEPVRPPAILQLATADDDRRCSVMVAPVRRGDRLGLRAAPLALVFVSVPRLKPVLDSDGLIRMFGLSAAEASIALGLMEGDSPAEIADRRQVAQETVRSQVKSVLAKTGTRRQGELIALLSRSLAALRLR